MLLSDFKIRRRLVELRYDPALLLWDRAGALWTSAQKVWPDLKSMRAMPNETTFRLGKTIEMSAQWDRMVLLEVLGEMTSEKFTEMAQRFTDIVSRGLEIQMFNRVGCRVIFFKPFGNLEDAAKYMLSSGLLNPPSGKLFGVDGKPNGAEFMFTSEEKNQGVAVRLRTSKVTIDAKPQSLPPVGEAQFLHDEDTSVEYDVDVFLNGPLPMDKLVLGDWLQGVFHSINRDSHHFLQAK
ncbi:MAG: hypothetical protein ACLP05_11375 [Candidatus Kryptoniota bacterium]